MPGDSGLAALSFNAKNTLNNLLIYIKNNGNSVVCVLRD